MIRMENVTKRYSDTVAVDNLSIEVGEGEVCTLIGPSGCGKTTTLRMINRLTEPTSGGSSLMADNSQLKPERLRQSIGYAIQSVGLFPHLTVAANIAVVPQLRHWTKPVLENGSRSYWSWLASLLAMRRNTRTSFPAVKPSVSASPALWLLTRLSCSWTSRSARLTR